MLSTKINENNPKEIHIWDFPDNLYILLDRRVNDLFFKRMYTVFGTQKQYARFLKKHRQEINKYHRQIKISHSNTE